jgi:biopolymer transport protein ExbB/TolQ
MDTSILDLWRSVGLIAKVVVLALTAMSVYLVVATIQARQRWQALVQEVGRVEKEAESAEKASARTARRDAVRLLGRLELRVATIGNLAWGAALVGFFGTVIGLVNGLLWVARSGGVEPTVFSAGIAEALVTLVWGLILAMAAGLGWSIFRGRSASLKLRTMLALE